MAEIVITDQDTGQRITFEGIREKFQVAFGIGLMPYQVATIRRILEESERQKQPVIMLHARGMDFPEHLQKALLMAGKSATEFRAKIEEQHQRLTEMLMEKPKPSKADIAQERRKQLFKRQRW